MIGKKGLARVVQHYQLCLTLLFLSSPSLNASCPTTTPWSDAVQLTVSADISSNIFSAGTSAGFMAVWADSSNNAHYSFSANGIAWQDGSITSATGNVATNSDVFVAGNSSGFMAAWMDSSNDAWSSFTTDNGATWSTAIKINGSTALYSDSDVYVSGGTEGFVAALVGNDRNPYVSFSTGTSAWSSLAHVSTSSGSNVYTTNLNSKTGRTFVSAAVSGNSCMISWLSQDFPTYSAYFESINPLSSATAAPIINVGFAESASILATLNGYFMAVARTNSGPSGETYFSTATTASNWGTFSAFAPNPSNPLAGPWVAANHAGFMATWIVGAGTNDPGTPIWTLSANYGFNWTSQCSILQTESTTILGPVGLSANDQGFVATWLDGNDSNAYAAFYYTPVTNSSGNAFVGLLQTKYGPLL